MYSLFSTFIELERRADRVVDDKKSKGSKSPHGSSNGDDSEPPPLTLSPLAQSSLRSVRYGIDDSACQPSRTVSSGGTTISTSSINSSGHTQNSPVRPRGVVAESSPSSSQHTHHSSIRYQEEEDDDVSSPPPSTSYAKTVTRRELINHSNACEVYKTESPSCSRDIQSHGVVNRYDQKETHLMLEEEEESEEEEEEEEEDRKCPAIVTASRYDAESRYFAENAAPGSMANLMYGGMDDSNKAVKHGWGPSMYFQSNDDEFDDMTDSVSFSGESVEARIIFRQINGLGLSRASLHTSTAHDDYKDDSDSSSSEDDDDESSYWRSPPRRKTSGEALFAALLAAQSNAMFEMDTSHHTSSHHTFACDTSDEFQLTDTSNHSAYEPSTPNSVWNALLATQGNMLSLNSNSSHHTKKSAKSDHDDISEEERRLSKQSAVLNALVEAQRSALLLQDNSSHRTSYPGSKKRKEGTPASQTKLSATTRDNAINLYKPKDYQRQEICMNAEFQSEKQIHTKKLGHPLTPTFSPAEVINVERGDYQSLWNAMLAAQNHNLLIREISSHTCKSNGTHKNLRKETQKMLGDDNRCSKESTGYKGRQYNPNGPSSTFMARMEEELSSSAKIQAQQASSSKEICVQQRRALRPSDSKESRRDVSAETPTSRLVTTCTPRIPTSTMVTTCTPRMPLKTSSYRNFGYKDNKVGAMAYGEVATTPPGRSQQQGQQQQPLVPSRPGAFSVRQVSRDTDSVEEDDDTFSYASTACPTVISAPWALVVQSRRVSTGAPLVEVLPEEVESIAKAVEAVPNKESSSPKKSRVRKLVSRFFSGFRPSKSSP